MKGDISIQNLKNKLINNHNFDDTSLERVPTKKLEKELTERQVEAKHYYKCFKYTHTESIEYELMRRRGETS